ncbi:MAG: transcription antitermination factor NusB [Bacillota bacterium]
MSRRRAREAALIVLFQIDVGHAEPEEALGRTVEDWRIPDPECEYIKDVIFGTLAKLERIDDIIRRLSRDWKIERMNSVDRNLMRLTLFELLYREDIPPNVSINEAIELSKRYGGEESPRFINGILGKVAEKLEEYRKGQ